MSHDAFPHLRLLLFGSPQMVLGDGTPLALRSRKHTALLFYLAMEQRSAISRDALLALLWPEANEEAARNNLRVALADLRRALGAGSERLLHITRHSVQFNPQSDHLLDALQFRALLDAAARHPHDAFHTCAECVRRVEQAVALYGGEFLHGFNLPNNDAFDEWGLLVREQLHQGALDALETLATAAEQGGDHAAQCRYARRVIELEPWREAAHVHLMRGLWMSGERGAALEQYAICVRALADELGIEPDAATQALAERIRNGVQPFHHPVVAPSYRLPTELTPCIGREREIAQISHLLIKAAERLVTLLGPGGVGKTRLALAAAHALHAHRTDICWVALAGVGADETPNARSGDVAGALIARAIAEALAFPLTGEQPETVQLQAALSERSLILVLDNLEHLTEGAPWLLVLLQHAPQLQILVTSRERLNISIEHVLPLDGLHLPPSDNDPSAASYSGVQLFLQRAARAAPTLPAPSDDLPAVVRLCRLLEGMPLGIELAAHWVAHYSVGDIISALRENIDFLATNRRDSPERHRSLRAVFDHSWQLLPLPERQLLARIAIFHGSFSRAAAQNIAQANVATLAALVDKSLLRQVGVGRYAMHELLRQFAFEQLDAMGDEQTTVEARHSAFYLGFIVEREARLARSEPQAAAVEIRGELDNIRHAWAWAATHAAIEELDACAWGFWQYYKLTGVSPDVEHVWRLAAERVRAQREHSPADDQARERTERVVSKLLALHAFALLERGAYGESIAVASQAIALALPSVSTEGEVIGYFVRGAAQYRQGHYLPASIELQRTLELLAIHTRDHPTYESFGVVEWMAHTFLAAINFRLGNYSATSDHCQQGLQLCRAQGRRFGEASCLRNLADVAREVRDLPSARRSYEQALRLSTSVGYRRGEGLSELELGDVLRLQGEYASALDTTERALATLREIGDVLETARAAAYLGRLYSYLGDEARAHDWFAEFSHNATIAGSPEMVVDGLIPRAMLALRTGDAEQALADAEQAQTLAQAYSGPYAQAAALVVFGRAQAALGRAAAAESYRQALSLYEQLDNPPLAAEPRAGLAAIALAGGEQAEALAHVEVLLRVLAEHPRVGLDEPFDVYLTCYRVLEANGDRRAGAIMNQAHALLLAYADQISDGGLRHSFIENVPAHREIAHVSATLALSSPLDDRIEHLVVSLIIRDGPLLRLSPF